MAALADPEIVNVPSCSHLSVDDWNPNKAEDFDPTNGSYLKGLVPSAIGGFVIGAICVALGVSLAIWLLVTRLRNRTWKSDLKAVHGSDADLDKADAERANVQLGGRRAGSGGVEERKSGIVFKGSSRSPVRLGDKYIWLFAALTVAAAGLCLWALIQSVLAVQSSADSFWGIFDDAQARVKDALTATQSLVGEAKQIHDTFNLLWFRASQGNGTLPAGVPANATELLHQAAQQFEPAILTGTATAASIQTHGIQEMQAFEHSYRSSTLRIQHWGLPIVLGVFYALLTAGCAIAGGLGIYGWRPRLLGWLTVALWLMAAFVMLFGAGVMNSGQTVTKDACLYTEALAFKLARQKQPPEAAQQLRTGLRYYFGAAPLPVPLVGRLIYGLDFEAIQATLQTPEVQQVTDFLKTDAGQEFLSAGKFNSTGSSLVEALPGALAQLTIDVGNLEDAVNEAAFEPLYRRAKEVLCCEWTDDVRMLFMSWTASGVAVVLLAAALSVRVHSLVLRPGREHDNLLSRAWQALKRLVAD